jgi:gamma-glutamyltranspeptidase / glutathione hydrolase
MMPAAEPLEWHRNGGDKMGSSSRLVVDRVEAVSNGGMVAAKTPLAAAAGAEVLELGGNAVDAAVVCALTAGVVEPWMNGIGGGGYLVRHDPATNETTVVEFPMVSPQGATPEMFPLSGAGPDEGLFGWPGVVDSANIVGHRAVCVPGTVAGLALALETYGTLSLADAVQPAIHYAEEGFPVTWHTSHQIARDLLSLNRFPATRAIFCPNGVPLWSLTEQNLAPLRQTDLAQTLRVIADQGPQVFYEGELAEKMVSELTDGGAPFSLDDFASYQAQVVPALSVNYGAHRVSTIGEGTGGVTLAQSLRLLDRAGAHSLGHNTPERLHLMAQAFRLAFADRFAYLADPSHVDVPIDGLLSADYLNEQLEQIKPQTVGSLRPGKRESLGISHQLAHSRPDYTSGGSTTHLSVIDRDGVAVSLTQTLLSLWGSRVVVPGTGILLNNGMMWFDPEPGRPNSVAGRKKPLSNMSPAVISKDGETIAAIGASGGRRIMNCTAQIVMNLIDHGMSMQEAVSAPRIDYSTPTLFASTRIDPATIEALRSLGHMVELKDETLLFGEFSSPACVSKQAGAFRGGVDPYYYPSTAIGVSID